MAGSALNLDFERRSLWSATMPALPDRTGRDLPDTTDVVVIGGGYAGINAARELARRGVAVTLLEAHTLGWGASTRNGGIVHPGYKCGPRKLVKRYGKELGPALYQDTLDGYETVKRLIAEESIDCDFRECGYFELAWAGEHMIHLEQQQASLAAIGVTSTMVPRDKVREEIGTDAYHGGLVVPGSGLLHPGRYFAGLAAAADRAGADLHEGVRATADPAPGGRPFRRRDRTWRDPGARRFRRHQRLHRRRRAVAAPPDHPDRELHHRQRAASRGARARALAQGPCLLRYQELPVLLARHGRPADGLRRPGEHAADLDRPDRRDPPQGAARRSTRSSPATGSTTRGAATSASPSTGCRTSGGRRMASPTRWAAAGRVSR